jgi:UDP-glucose 4-epimerase
VALFVVTGGAGFIGSHLVEALIGRGHRVRVVDDLSSGRLENLPPERVGEVGSGAPIELSRADVAEREPVRSALRGASGVFHEAAQVSVPASMRDPEKSYRVNVMGTLNVLEAARAEGVKKVVFAASSAAYGDVATLPKREEMTPRPLSPYAAGKLAGETLLATWGLAFGLETVALRYFNVYGPRQADDSPYSGVIAQFARRLLERRAPTIYGDGEQSRDFVFVEDVVRANLLAMERKVEAGAVINVGTGKSVTVHSLCRLLTGIAESSIEPVHQPARAGDVRHSLASIERARAWLGFEPRVELEEGLRRTFEWYRGRART